MRGHGLRSNANASTGTHALVDLTLMYRAPPLWDNNLFLLFDFEGGDEVVNILLGYNGVPTRVNERFQLFS